MIYSMTGYGKADKTTDDITYQIEIKSLNSKYFDPVIRLPQELRAMELSLRKLLENRLQRGKISFQITPQGPGTTRARRLHKELLKNYVQQINETFAHLDRSQIVASLLRNPDIWYTEEDTDAGKLYENLLPAIEKAIADLIAFRRQEGKEIEADMRHQMKIITEHLNEIKKNAPRRKEKLKTKLILSLKESDAEINPERFEQELIYYLDKWDINEEISRLKNHLHYFDETLQDENHIQKGKKLQFIAQEMGREINTLGAKANDALIQRHVVQMKDALEKIKEQTANTL